MGTKSLNKAGLYAWFILPVAILIGLLEGLKVWTTVPIFVAYILMFGGLIVGLLNIGRAERTQFLVAVLILLGISAVLTGLPLGLPEILTAIMGRILQVIGVAGLVVAITAVIKTAQK